MRRFFLNLPRRIFLLLMLGGSVLITLASLAYFDFGTLAPFVIEKLPLKFESLWLASLRVHVASALVSLPLCLVLMTKTIQRFPRCHRWLGRVAGVLVLFALVPSGIVLAFEAKGGLPVTVGFLLSGAIVAFSVVRGVAAIRRRELVTHRRAMRHVVAQMTVAVTSRVLIVGLDAAGMAPGLAYVIALWGPVLFHALVAELVSFRPKFSPVFERIRREVSPSVSVVRVRSLVRPVARLGR